MSELAQYLIELGKAHGFALEELEANRAGQLHPRQRRRAGRLGAALTATLLTVLSAGAGSVGALLYYEDVRKPLERLDRNALVAIIAATAVVTLIFLGLTLAAWRSRAKRVAAFQAGALRTLAGPALKSCIEGRGGAPSSWWLTLEGRRFPVTRATWDRVTHGAQYRGYVCADVLLSFEPAAPPA